MHDGVLTSLELLDDWNLGILKKTIDDTLWQRRAAAMKKEKGNGIIRERGQAVAVHTLSIPIDEFSALLMTEDPDAVEWNAHPNDRNVLRRLVARFPHWRISGASV